MALQGATRDTAALRLHGIKPGANAGAIPMGYLMGRASGVFRNRAR